MTKTMRRIDELKSPRANAYAVMGLCLWNGADISHQIELLLKPILDGYRWWSGENWQWFEEKMTYCNAVIPHALLLGASALRNKEYFNIAISSLDFLLDSTIRENRFWPVGCKEWFGKDGENAWYDQQPVDACATLLACLTAHRLTCDQHYLRVAYLCLRWYHGKNSGGIDMIRPETGGCFDGITRAGPNLNQGAESMLSWYGSVIGFNLYLKQVQIYEHKEEFLKLVSSCH